MSINVKETVFLNLCIYKENDEIMILNETQLCLG